MERASRILCVLQTRYRERFGEDLGEFASLDAGFSAALHASGNALATARRAADAEAFQELLAHVRSQDATRLPKREQKRLATALDALDRHLGEYQVVDRAARATRSARDATAALAAARPPSRERPEEPAELDRRMGNFLLEMEEEIQRVYPPTDTSFINLSLEPALRAHFREAHARLGATPARERVMRAAQPREAPATYRPRL